MNNVAWKQKLDLLVKVYAKGDYILFGAEIALLSIALFYFYVWLFAWLGFV